MVKKSKAVKRATRTGNKTVTKKALSVVKPQKLAVSKSKTKDAKALSKDASAMSHWAIETPFGMAAPPVFCPACGKGIFTEDAGSLCEHVIFTYCEDFDYVAPAYENMISDIEAETEDAGGTIGPEAFFARLTAKSVLKLSITFGGMACGPVWYSAYAAIDFAPDANHEAGKAE